MIKIKLAHQDNDEIDLTSVMDVIFILLIFFIIAASFTVRGLEVDLPAAKASQAVSGRVIEIRLSEKGLFFIDGIPTAKADIPYKLQSIVRTFRQRPGQFVLYTSPKAPAGDLIYLVDQVKSSGGEKLMVATSRPQDSSANP